MAMQRQCRPGHERRRLLACLRDSIVASIRNGDRRAHRPGGADVLVCEDAAYCESCPRRDVVPRLESRRCAGMELFSKSGKAHRSPLSPPSCRRESSARRLLRFAPSWTCISTPAHRQPASASPYIAAQAPVPYELVDRLLALTTLRHASPPRLPLRTLQGQTQVQ